MVSRVRRTLQVDHLTRVRDLISERWGRLEGCRKRDVLGGSSGLDCTLGTYCCNMMSRAADNETHFSS